ncbi:N-acetyltransferase family protein [Actinomycetota bacterium]
MDERVRLRDARASDVDALTDLHIQVWEEAYGDLVSTGVLAERRAGRDGRVQQWRQNITSERVRTIVASDDDGRLLGFVRTGPGRDGPEAGLPKLEVRALYVRAEVYGGGVGYALLQEGIGQAEAYLWVLQGNERAISFYERQGFWLDGTSKAEPVGIELRMVRRAL